MVTGTLYILKMVFIRTQ